MSYSDYDNDFITARNITPPLERVDPRYRHESTPPPLVSADESDSVCSIGERSHKGDDGKVVGSRSTSKPTHRRLKRRKRHHGRQSRPPLLGNEVLLMNLAPDQPHLARELAQVDPSSYEEEGEGSEDETENRSDGRVDHVQFQHVRNQAGRKPMTNGHPNDVVDYMDLDDDEDFSDTQKSSMPRTSRSMSHQSTANSPSANDIAQPHALVGSPTAFSTSKTPLNLLPPPLPLNRLSPRSPLSIDPRQVKEEDSESLLTSPNLGRFTISSPDGNPDDMLPAISPPRSATDFNSDVLHRLPSLQTTIDMETMHSPRSYSISASSPTGTQWHHYGVSPLPFSALSPGYNHSPAGAPMQAQHHPFRTRENSIGMAALSEPSEYSISTPNSVATPATTVSSSSYSTSIGVKSEYQHQRTFSQPSLVAQHHSWQSQPFQNHVSNGFHGPSPQVIGPGQKRKSAPRLPTLSTSSSTSTAVEPFSDLKSARRTDTKTSSPNRDHSHPLTREASTSPVEATVPSTEIPSASSTQNNIYQCTFPTCSAPPFGTQYLLNSHANVHSFSRPHYCNEPGCNRGPGGMGFKRKNEMIRCVPLANPPRARKCPPAPLSLSVWEFLN